MATPREKAAVIFRKIITITAPMMIFLLLVLQFLGFIPFKGRSLSLIPAINNIFEFTNYGKASFINCTVSILFSIIYFYIAVKSLIALVFCIKRIGWNMKMKHNISEACYVTEQIVRTVNFALLRFLLLYVFSHVLYPFSINLRTASAIALLILGCTLMGVGNNLIQRNTLCNSIVSACNLSLLLTAFLLFGVTNQNLQLLELIHFCEHLFKMIDMNVSTAYFNCQIVCQLIILPIIHFVMLLSILLIYRKINKNTFNNSKFINYLLIRNAIFLGIVMILTGYVNSYTDIADYLHIIYQNLPFVLMTALLPLTILNRSEE
ncbi:MAG: hypothetical protein IJW49_11120 [Clostridia bacterium]|nr:hypothetical protein [Clostridia bacterium]